MKKLQLSVVVIALFALGTPLVSLAGDTLLMDPARVTCRLGAGTDYKTKKCDVLFDDLLVHEGRSTSESFANGDCVKCKGVVSKAISLGREVKMFRGYWGSELADWHLDGFFTVDGLDGTER